MKVKRDQITQEYANKIFSYKDGVLIWKGTRARRVKNGSPAGTLCPNGYLRVSTIYGLYYNHQVIFLMHHGYIPEITDHINTNTLDNHILNLRECNSFQSARNTGVTKDSITGVKNVYTTALDGVYRVALMADGVNYRKGGFTSIEVAKKHIRKIRVKHHGEFANHG